MSLDLETRLRVFLASAPPALRSIQTLEFSHPAMPQVFHLWREPYEGTITTENGIVQVQPVNFQMKLAGTEQNLDQNFQINLDTTDIEDAFREQLDLIPVSSPDRIACVYREYLSDDLTDMQASVRLQVDSISYTLGVATIVAVSPRLNASTTGDRYVPRDCPMLRALL